MTEIRAAAAGDDGGGAPLRQSLYGRRRGRPLRKKRQALVETLLPRLSVDLPESGRLDPQALFPGDAPPEALWLEIGFGAGEHLAWQAARNPGVGVIGAEVFINGIAGLLSRIDEESLENVRIFRGDGREILSALPDASFERVIALFPDPWRKSRHHRRRLVRRATLAEMARVLRDGGELRLATDHRDYLGWMLERLSGHPDFDWTARGPQDWRRRPDDWPQTRYERKALEEGRNPSFLRYIRRPRRPVGDRYSPRT